MPVSLVKVSAVSFWMSTICGLPTISTLMDDASPPPVWPAAPPPPPPPAPAHPAATSAEATRPDAAAVRHHLEFWVTAPPGNRTTAQPATEQPGTRGRGTV